MAYHHRPHLHPHYPPPHPHPPPLLLLPHHHHHRRRRDHHHFYSISFPLRFVAVIMGILFYIQNVKENIIFLPEVRS